MFTSLNFDLKKGIKTLYGNPDLKPERTRAIELSYKRTFWDTWMLSFTYFNKDIAGLVDTRTFLASDSKAEDDGFTQFANLAGGSTNVFELLKKIWQLFFRQSQLYPHACQEAQRQTFVGDIFIGVPQKFGMDILWRWNSPRPYTYYPSRTGYVPDLSFEMKPNNSRMRIVSYLEVKIFKNWKEPICDDLSGCVEPV